MIQAIINPLSLDCAPEEFTRRLANIRKFRLLVDKIVNHTGPIGCHCKPDVLRVGGYPICSLYGLPEGFTREATSLLRGMLNHLTFQTELSTWPDTFTLTDFPPSPELGFAHANSCTALSFTFDRRFAVPELHGLINDRTPGTIPNWHSHRHLPALDPIQRWCPTDEECARHNALKEPMWNKGAMEEYLATIQRPFPADDKRNCNLKHGDAIARINGWTYDQELTTRNTTRDKIRRIYNSSRLGGRAAYLSIDLEKIDIHFERHDHNGIHLGEINTQGTPTDTPHSSHNIKV